MKIKQKKIISVFLAILMLLSVLPMGTMTASAAGGVKSKLDSFISKYPSGSRWTGTFDGGSQCYGFGKLVVYNIFGMYSSSRYRSWSYNGTSTSGMNIVGSITNYSANNVKDLLSKAKCGDVLQFDTTKQHTMIVYSVDSTGVTIYDCNWDNNCGISKRHSAFGAWSGRNSSKLTLLRSDNYSSIDGSDEPHVCEFTGSYFESAHPHKEYRKCSCGKTQYTGSTGANQNCSTCMKLSWSYVQPVKAYTINTGKTTVYNAVNGTAKSNKIYDTDLCTISQIYDCGWCKVTFPLDSGGTDTGYCKISVFMKGGGFYLYASKQITTYRRSDLKTSIGYAGSGDKIYILGTASSAVQIAYPLTAGGWKVGWVPTSAIKCTVGYNANGGTGSMSSSTVQYNGKITLTENKYTKTGYTFGGWNAYRSSDKKWYVAGQGWKTESEISSNGYSKKVYGIKTSFTLEQSWIGTAKTNDTLTFYAVWKPNTLSVSYNANGGKILSDTYELSSNVVYKKSDGSKYVQKWSYNSAKTNGLVNASTFGLTRDDYTFKGWGTTASGGTVFDQNDAALVPTKINANIKNGDCTTTLYAIWEKKDKPITHTHEWNSDYTIDKEPTCTENGLKSIHCKSCNETKDSVAVPMADHSYSDVISKEATCTQEGIREKVCSVCGLHTDKETIPMLEHEFGEWEIKQEATSSHDGIESRKCRVCSYVETRTIDYIPVYDETAPRISMASVSAKAGEEAEVQIKIENNPGITALRAVVDYDDTALEMISFTFGDALSSMNKGTSEKYGNHYSFSMYSARTDLADNGTLAIIKFKVKDEAKDGEYPITITYDPDDIFNIAGDSVKFDIEVGSVLVDSSSNVTKDAKIGDTDLDGTVTITDATLIQRHLAKLTELNETQLLCADTDADGEITILDTTMIQLYLAKLIDRLG